MDEENAFCRFGTALEPLDEDEIPSKKPIAIEDQIVTDSNGKRRFHGAFTGGFSAGFWNTVGSLEGWKPQNFKSSRSEKAGQMTQRATDFMDEEDLGEFGIAPQRVQTTDDFTPQEAKTSDRKRKLQQIATGPIPGVPVLHQLLEPAKDNVAIRLLKKMGWKEGQGIGARQTRKEKNETAKRNARERYVMKMYGCDMGPMQTEVEEESDISDEEITFAPDDFQPFVCSIKDNTFGLGYTGLNRNPVLGKQHINLFGPFEVMGKGNKKLSIRGQAFGVGALEEEDEDIYARDDMTKYDFSLEDAKTTKTNKKEIANKDNTVLEGFQPATDSTVYKKVFTIQVPADYKPRNWAVRKSRFEPLDDTRATLLRKQDEHKTKGLGRHDLNPESRGNILGEGTSSKAAVSESEKDEGNKPKKKSYLERINEKYKSKEKKKSEEVIDMIASKFDSFTKGEVLNESLDAATQKENEKLLKEAVNITKSLDKNPGVFKPFVNNDAKQERYEKFVKAELKDDEEITSFLSTIQPLNMSDWDKEMEKKEFIQARNIYKPLKGLMSDRFISEAKVVAEREVTEKTKETNKKIEMKRTKTMWKPCSQLCKRFNVEEPFGGTMEEMKVEKKSRFSVFDYLETSINTKENFATPVIIPTKTEKPKLIIQQPIESSNRVSTKELFSKEISTPTLEWKNVVDNKPTEDQQSDKIKKTNQKPKTALEKKIEETKNKHPSEKKDLFKAIFDSSSEDEPDAEDNSNTTTAEASLSTITDAHKDIFATMKQSAADINVLRNTSPPRGIFANLFTKKPVPDPVPDTKPTKNDENQPKIVFKSRNERSEEDVYGPQIPTTLVPSKSAESTAKDSDIDAKLIKLLKSNKKDKKIVEKWIEKQDGSSDKKKKKKDKKKKSKKHKKEKKNKK